jgi:hypothetical protein
MPAQKKSGGLLAKYGDRLRNAHEQYAAAETNYGNINLPNGIDMGVALLTDLKIGEYKSGDNQGEPFFMARAAVVRPKVHGGMKVEGLSTTLGPEPLCDVKKGKRETFEDHVGWVYNELRKLGIDTTGVDPDGLEQLCEEIKNGDPIYIRFRTWQGEATEQYPNPRVNEEWQGAIDYTPEEGDDVQDNTTPPAPAPARKTPAASTNGHKPAAASGAKPSTPVARKTAPAPPTRAASAKDKPEESVPFGDDLDMLGEKAAENDADAIVALTKRARAIGWSDKQINDAAKWEDVVEAIREAETPEETAEAETEEESAEEGGGEDFVPAVKDVVYFKPPKAKKAVECEVTAVFEGNRTVNLKNLDDGKSVYKAISFDALGNGP